jgi:hypothetical protein
MAKRRRYDASSPGRWRRHEEVAANPYLLAGVQERAATFGLAAAVNELIERLR